MKKLFYALLFITSFGFSQNKPILKIEGVPSVITEVEGKTSAELFTKTKEWIQLNYKNPSEVLKAEIPNEMIRIEGFSKSFFCQNGLVKQYYDIMYTVEFSFKDGKYLFDFKTDQITYRGQGVPFLSSTSTFFKKDGSQRSIYKSSIESFSVSLTNLYNSHYDYITGKTQLTKKDW